MSRPKFLCPDGIFHFPSGREVCALTTKLGWLAYRDRILAMRERQGGMCCYYGHLPECHGKLFVKDMVFAHEIPRGHGGGSRDDRILLPDGRRLNGAAHSTCNLIAGSRRIRFNDAYNATVERRTQRTES